MGWSRRWKGAPSLLGSHVQELFFIPQNDPDKEYNMPKDGTVHELTSNVGAALGLPMGRVAAAQARHRQPRALGVGSQSSGAWEGQDLEELG